MDAIGMLFNVHHVNVRVMPCSFRRSLSFLVTLALVTGLHAQRSAPGRPLTRLLFVMDASNSMNAFWGNGPKIETARTLLLKSLVALEGRPDLELALRLYGHQTPIQPNTQDCDDTRLEVPFSRNSIPAMRTTLNAVRCLGTTPIARSLERSGGDFPSVGTENGRPVRNIIILITDGIEACDEDPCAVSRVLQARGITLKPFVIGVGLGDADKYSLQCVGSYFDASTPELFAHVLDIVVTQALNSTTAQISLMTEDNKPAETDVPVSLYDQKSGELRYHLMHTMNARGIPDTLIIDPIFTYRAVVHTVPASVRENVTLAPGTHNIIAIDAGMGSLLINSTGAGNGVPYVIRRTGESITLCVQEIGMPSRLRTGRYDVEVLTVPRSTLSDVHIAQGNTTRIDIPEPGTLDILPATAGHGAVFVQRGVEWEWVADLDPSIIRPRYTLQPGRYQVMYRSRSAHRSSLSISKEITIESGRSAALNF